MDWTNTRDERDAIDAAAAMQRRIAEGRHRPFHSALFGGLDFLTFGHGANAGALRNRLDPGAGAPATQGEVARLRQQSPWAYYGGQGFAGLGSFMASPLVGALQTGAALANAPAVQRNVRDFHRSTIEPAQQMVAFPPQLLMQAAHQAMDRPEGSQAPAHTPTSRPVSARGTYGDDHMPLPGQPAYEPPQSAGRTMQSRRMIEALMGKR